MSGTPLSNVLTFDGKDDYVLLPAMTLDCAKGFTIEAWARWNSFKAWSRIIDFGNGGGASNIVLANNGTLARLAFGVHNSSGSENIFPSSDILAIGRWTHVAATVDSAGNGTLYVDGKAVHTAKALVPQNVRREQNYIGKSHWSSDGYFDGQIAELRVWTVARSQGEIEANMKRRLVGTEAGLCAYYRFDEGAGNAVKDSSVLALASGTIQGATWAQAEVPLGPAVKPSIAGVVNTYATVTAVAGDTVLLGGATNPFRPQDRVLVVQMAGAVIDTSDTESFGTITNDNGAGRYAWATVVSVSGLGVKLSETLAGFDGTNGKVQIVLVSSHPGDVVVKGKVEARAWDGSSGGVIAVEAAGTIEVWGDIDASSKGFQGGQVSANSGVMSQLGYTSAGAGGYKGAGIATIGPEHTSRRGAPANGGGGGNEHKAGGGGGGNGGAGGRGSVEYHLAPGGPKTNGGIGGRSLDFIDRIFMGGGGGGGHQNNSTGTAGGSGGGIILLRASAILGAMGRCIRANGSHAATATWCGAGGGGAGGTIVLDTATLSGTLCIEAKGGNGGHTGPETGSGGGGGGGTIRTNAALPGSVTTSVIGGDYGLSAGKPCGPTASTPGIIGPLLTRAMTRPSLTGSFVNIPAKSLTACGKGTIKADPNYSDLTITHDLTGFIEWTVSLPRAGKWYLHCLMTAVDKRPVTLTINGVKQDGTILGETTGGWYSDKLRWFVYGPYDFKPGDNVFRIDFTKAHPCLKEFAFSESMLGIAPVVKMTKDFAAASKAAVGTDPESGNLTVTYDASGYLEWKVHIPKAGQWQLHALLASGGARPCALSINGTKQSAPILGENTGGYSSDKVRWFPYGPYDFRQGENVVRIDFTACQPHLLELGFTPAEETEIPSFGHLLVPILAKDFIGPSSATVRENASYSNLLTGYAQPGYYEWKATLPRGGKWYLHALMASPTYRPCDLTINGQKQSGQVLAATTGGDKGEALQWVAHGPYDFKEGENLLRIDWGAQAWPPHLKMFALYTEPSLILVKAKDASAVGGGVNTANPQYSNFLMSTWLASYVEWKVSIPRGGKWLLHALMTGKDSRPSTLSINGQKQSGQILSETTGDWYSATLQWRTYGPYGMKQGDNLLRIDFTGYTAHLRELVFSADPNDPATLDRTLGEMEKKRAALEQRVKSLEEELDKHVDCELKLAEQKAKVTEQAKKLAELEAQLTKAPEPQAMPAAPNASLPSGEAQSVEATPAPGLADYGYWQRWKESLPPQGGGDGKPFRRGMIWR